MQNKIQFLIFKFLEFKKEGNKIRNNEEDRGYHKLMILYESQNKS